MKYLAALAVALGTATLIACEAKQEQPATETAQGPVVSLAITGMT
jgi:hypothetical protein